MKIFGDVDKTKEGKTKSEFPSWYFETQKEDLEESVRHKKSMLEQDLVPASERNIMRERLKQESTRLDQIEASTPRFTEKEIDDISKLVNTRTGATTGTLSAKIAESMFTKSDMDRGTTDAHEEARRISRPCIKLDEKELDFAKACEIPISTDGKVTRSGAEKMWKIGRRIIGETSNTEVLRRK
jgi:hypothetical protein